MAIKNPIYLFLPLQINLGIVFTLKARNFQFNCVQVPIHIFISAHATKIHIPPTLFGPGLIPWPADAKS